MLYQSMPFEATSIQIGFQVRYDVDGGMLFQNSRALRASGTNITPAGAMNSMNAAFTPFSAANFSKAFSVSWIFAAGDWPFAATAKSNIVTSIKHDFITGGILT